MKKQIQHRMRQVGLVGLVLAALVAIDGGQMGKARAEIRVHARIDTPHVSVHFGNGPRQGRAQSPFVYRITHRDREIARHLAYRTGHRPIVLLDLRARGLSWKQIGRRLDIPRREIRLAVRSTDHQTRGRGGVVTCGNRWR
jgi:hypothetical protein